MGFGGGGGSQTATTTSKSEPWISSQPYLRDVMSNAQRLFRTGGDIPGQAVPFAPETETALRGYTNRALTGNPLVNQATGAASGILNASNPGRGTVEGVATGATSLGNQQARDLLSSTAAGDYIGSNPVLDQVLARQGKAISDNVNAIFAKGGRYGSTAHQNALAESIGDAASGILYPAYESERGRQLQAAGALESASQGDTATRLSAADLLGNLQGRDATTKLGAIGVLPGLREYGNADLNDLIKVGATREGLQSDFAADRLAQYNEPWRLLGNYSGAVNGLAGLGGTNVTTGQQPRSNPFLSGLSGASAGAGIAGAVNALNPYALPLTIGGGLLGLFG